MTKGLRYLFGSDWADRQKRMADDLSALREHRGYHALTDMLEGDLRALWRAWLDEGLDDMEAHKVRTEAIILFKLLANLDGITAEKELREMQDRMYQGLTTDRQMDEAIAEHLQSGQSSPAGEGVY